MEYTKPKPTDSMFDEYIGMVQVPQPGRTNPAYENCDLPCHSHRYEEPSKLSPQLGRIPRLKNNDLYEPTGPLRARKMFMSSLDQHAKTVENNKDSFMNRVVLVMILLVSVAALVLVVLLITGYIGQCACAKQGTQQKVFSRSITSLEPLEYEMEKMRANITHIRAMLIRQQITTDRVQAELVSTKQEFEYLKINRSTSGTDYWNSSRVTISKLSQELTNVKTKLNSTQNKMETEVSKSLSLERKVNRTSEQLSNDMVLLKAVVNKTLNQTQESLLKIARSLDETTSKRYQSLIEKVENVSKMAGPMGPRGHNGTQGPRGYPGANGTRGLRGPIGVNGSQGLPGPQGIRGVAGAGNLSLCEYKTKSSSPWSPGSGAANSVIAVEPADKRIMGVFCHTDRAALVKMDYLNVGGVRKYSCQCYGDSSYTALSNDMKCFVSYWQCPRETS